MFLKAITTLMLQYEAAWALCILPLPSQGGSPGKHRLMDLQNMDVAHKLSKVPFPAVS